MVEARTRIFLVVQSLDQILDVTEPDMEKLRHLLNSAARPTSKDQEHVATLEEALDGVYIVSPSQVPKDVVVMNSKVRMTDLNTGKEMTYTLVFPRDADLVQGKISLLAPTGTAILGCQADDVIEWKVPGSNWKIRVKQILISLRRPSGPPGTLPHRPITMQKWAFAPGLQAGCIRVDLTGVD